MKETTVTRRHLLGGAATAAAGGALLATPAGALAAPQRRCAVPTPAGFTKFIVYLREGVVEGTSDPEEFIAIRREFYGQSRSDLVAYAEQAKRFFLERFGLDFFGVDGPTFVGPWEIDGATLRAGAQTNDTYRAHVVSEDWVPSEGWVVRDSGLTTFVTKDMVLHGTWGGAAGKPAPAGAVMAFGDYSIKVERPGRSERGERILIHFESGSPIVPDVDGAFHFICDVTNEDWGTGCACGVVRADGGVRNVITFPASLQ